MKGTIRKIFINPSGNIRKTTRDITINVEATKNSSIRLIFKSTTDSEYYNFDTGSFAAAFDSIKHKFTSTSTFTQSIKIPTVVRDTSYTLEVIAINADINSSISSNPKLFSKTFTQVLDTTITFTPSTDTTGDFSGIGSSVTSTAQIIGDRPRKFSIDWTATAVASDSANALSIVKQPDIGDFYTETDNYVANGAGTGATSLILTSVSGLFVGMKLSSVEGTYQSALRVITAINGSTKTVTLSGAETWGDEEDIKFRAYGPDLMQLQSGILIEPKLLTVTISGMEKIVHGTTSSSTDVILGDILGIKTGTDVSVVTGPSIVPASPSDLVYVASIVSYGDKNIRLNTAQSFKDKEVLTFSGTAQTADISLDIEILKQPTSTTIVYFDVDNILISAI